MIGSDLTFSMLVKLMDGWSGPADRVRRSMRTLATGAKEVRTALGKGLISRFSTTELEAAFARSSARIGRARGRLLGAAAMAVAVGAPVLRAGNFEEKLIDFGNLAEVGRDRLERLKGELDALRDVTGQSNVDLLEGLASYVGKGNRSAARAK